MSDDQNSTFLTGVNIEEQQRQQQLQQQQEQQEQDNKVQIEEDQDEAELTLEELIVQVERQMRAYEHNAQYVDAERARQHLETLKRRKNDFSKRCVCIDLYSIQQNGR